jgi:hypothetical protein
MDGSPNQAGGITGVVDMVVDSAGMVNLFKKTMLSTVRAFCKKPWYLSK